MSTGVSPEVSIVMPCLNEEDTLGICIEKAQRSLREGGIAGEIIVADSGRSLALCPDRAPILAQLNQDAGRHLILVRYGPQHPPDHE